MIGKLILLIEKKLSGHVTIGNLTIYGANSMHWGVTYRTKRWGYICFRLPLPCFGRWWPLYFYVSPNATPWAATYMLGKKHSPEDWALAKIRKQRLGHGFDIEENREMLMAINDR